MSFPPANHDSSIDPTADQVRALRDHGPDGPIVMLNLLRFRALAAYPPGHPDAGGSGAEAYARYARAFTVTVGETSQAQVLFDGPVDQVFIGDPGSHRWDKCLIVRYPSRRHFLAMMADARYRDALVHRYAGLEKTLLLQMHGS